MTLAATNSFLLYLASQTGDTEIVANRRHNEALRRQDHTGLRVVVVVEQRPAAYHLASKTRREDKLYVSAPGARPQVEHHAIGTDRASARPCQ